MTSKLSFTVYLDFIYFPGKFYVDAMQPISVTFNNTEEVCQSLSGKEVAELMWDHLRSVIDNANQGTCRGNDRLVQ